MYVALYSNYRFGNGNASYEKKSIVFASMYGSGASSSRPMSFTLLSELEKVDKKKNPPTPTQ